MTMYEVRQNKEKVSRTLSLSTLNGRERKQPGLGIVQRNATYAIQYKKKVQNTDGSEKQQLEEEIGILQSSIKTTNIPSNDIEIEFQKCKNKLELEAQQTLDKGEKGGSAHDGSMRKNLVARLAGDLYAEQTKGKVESGHKNFTEKDAFPKWEERTKMNIKRTLERIQWKHNHSIQDKVRQL